MNLLGKICIVLILVASLVFMTLAMAVYATHTNWHEAAVTLEAELDQAQVESQQLRDSFARQQTNLQIEMEQLRQQLAQEETARSNLEQRNRQIEEQLTNLQQNLRTSTAAVAATEKQNQRLIEQRDELLAEIRAEQAQRDRFFEIAQNAAQQLQQRLADLVDARERLDQLVPQVARYKERLTALGINPDLPADFSPDVEGEILVVRQEGAQRLIEISIGSDDGLQRGQELIIYRNNRYLGKARVTRTDPDRAVAVVIPRSVEGNIQEGDRVATRIRLS